MAYALMRTQTDTPHPRQHNQSQLHSTNRMACVRATEYRSSVRPGSKLSCYSIPLVLLCCTKVLRHVHMFYDTLKVPGTTVAYVRKQEAHHKHISVSRVVFCDIL